ncbi:bacteriophage abortive infection AbiH family protein [Mesorhizobium silamurunense]|uniref:bacteriophage abortive infection AbiH family protein n=1 Tax=Mesorhizobium silamurunense TaxID=499528 RepID=UPI0017805D58|nr:bacteriophage abortive infection AbiH family protein [Mesorhizobium silamurunense]
MADRLFVIGNGFDLHHGIPSRYRDFGRYVEGIDRKVSELIRDYLFVDKDFWNCFEERLATFDSDHVIDYAENFLVSYGAEDWSDADHHNFEYEIEQIVDGLSRTMRKHFADWIRGLPIPLPGTVPLVNCIERRAKFLNFNYTPTLQSLYGVDPGQVLHIHGSAVDPDSLIVLGHGWERQADEMLVRQVDEDTDTRIAGGYRLIDDYFAGTFKPTEKILAQNQAFFDGLVDVSDVFILGHSLADVDALYVAEIANKVPVTARWTISCYKTPETERNRFSGYGVNAELVRFAPLSTL